MSTVITGNLKDLGTGAVTAGAAVRMSLQWEGGGWPRVNGTALLMPSNVNNGGDRISFPLTVNTSTGAITGTVYSTRDAAGTGDGEIEINGSLTACWYELQLWLYGRKVWWTKVHAKNGVTLDLTSVTPISTNPVVTAPTGDTTYLRLDGGNAPMTGQLVPKDGTAASPGIAFASSLTTGFFREAADVIGVAIAGTLKWIINSAGQLFGSAQAIAWSSNADPSLAAADTGLSRTAAATVAVGNGTAGNASGTLKLADIIAAGTPWIDIRAYGGVGDGVTDCTTAFNNALTAAYSTGADIYFPAGQWLFSSAPNAITAGIRIRGAGSTGSTQTIGTAIIVNYTELTATNGFFTWNGNNATSGIGTGGGISDISIYKGADKTGGTALKLIATDNNHRPGFFTLQNVIITGTSTGGTNQGKWNKNLIIDGSACTTSGAQGVRDVYISNFWPALAEDTADAIHLTNAVQVFWYGGEVFPASAGTAVGVTIDGSGSATGNSTNIWLMGVYITGGLTISNAKNVFCSMCQVGGNLNYNAGSASTRNDTIHFYGWVSGNFTAQASGGTNLFAGGELTGTFNDSGNLCTSTFAAKYNLPSAALSVGGLNSAVSNAGDISASRSATTGIIGFGTDGKSGLWRNADGTFLLVAGTTTAQKFNFGQAGGLGGSLTNYFMLKADGTTSLCAFRNGLDSADAPISYSQATELTANGGQWIQGQASENLTLSTIGSTTDTSANLLPANSIIEAVVARVTTTITTATDWKLGDATTAGRFTAADATMTAGETQVGILHWSGAVTTLAAGPSQASAAKVRVTTTGTPGAGAIRITVFYRQFVAPTS